MPQPHDVQPSGTDEPLPPLAAPTTPDKATTADALATGPYQGASVPPLPRVPGYAIEGVLGRGGMGIVYRATHLALKRTVALKMILAGGHADSEGRQRFRTEAEAVARLSHPHIVQVYEVGEMDGLPFCALEYVAGGRPGRAPGRQNRSRRAWRRTSSNCWPTPCTSPTAGTSCIVI